MPKQHNWNAYKIFKNGRRAKQPICKITANSAVEAEKNFLNEILPKLSDNFASYKWVFIPENIKSRSLSKQEVATFARAREKRKKIFVDIFSDLNENDTVLLVSKSNLNWEWAVCEPNTLKKIKSISPQFESKNAAFKWLDMYLDIRG